MIVVETIAKTKYYFSDEAEEKIQNYARENGFSLETAVYDLIDMGELDLELDSGYEDTDEPEITKVTM